MPTKKLTAAALATAMLAGAAEHKHSVARVAAVIAINVAGTYADMRSTQAGMRRGLYEANPVLATNGKFGARGAGIMWALTGAASVASVMAWRHGSTWEPVADIANASMGAGHLLAARHNSQLGGK